MADQNQEKHPAMQSNQAGRNTSSSRMRKAETMIPAEAPPVGHEVNIGQFLFEKRLTHSDVKGQNRMVIPKAHAEKFLTELAKVGSSSHVFMDDIRTGKVWKFCFRSWQNGGSRMYVLEGIGKYTQEQNIKVGDFIMIYRNEQTDKYQINWRKRAGHQEEHNHPGDREEKDDLPEASSKVDSAGKNEVQAAGFEVASADEYYPQFLVASTDEYHPQFLPQDETSQFVQTTDVIDPDYVLKNFNMPWDQFIDYNPFDD